ncbi:MAG TPA: hypothetical protein VFB72_15735 [Verrucomicrobiae bacterium]|nr:hypothetical protein [Verrucomicrobiae bacterium]
MLPLAFFAAQGAGVSHRLMQLFQIDKEGRRRAALRAAPPTALPLPPVHKGRPRHSRRIPGSAGKAIQFLFGDALMANPRNGFEQTPLNEPQDGFVFDLQKAGHFVCCIYFHCLSTFGRGAPIPSGHGAAHAMFQLRGEFRKTDLAEMQRPTNGNGRVMTDWLAFQKARLKILVCGLKILRNAF